MVQIDFGSTLNVSTAVASFVPGIPGTQAPTTATTSSPDVTLQFNWNKSAGDWSKLFMFKTDSTDMANAAATDILLTSDKTKFYSTNFLSADVISSGGQDSHTSVAKEYVAHAANNIFVGQAGADVFNNEEGLVTAVSNHHSTLLTLIKTAIEVAVDTAVPTDGQNPAWIVLSTLLNETVGGSGGDANNEAARFDDNALTSESSGTYNGYTHAPLAEDDVLVFGFTFNAIPATTHGVGANAITARTYRVEMTLKEA
jgi:hypothetical protein